MGWFLQHYWCVSGRAHLGDGGSALGDAKQRSQEFVVADMERIAAYLERANFAAYADLLRRPVRFALLNWVGGLFRGIGIGLGLTVAFTGIIYLLQALEVLNLPIVGKYIADVVSVVQAQLRVRTY